MGGSGEVNANIMAAKDNIPISLSLNWNISIRNLNQIYIQILIYQFKM